MAYMKILNDTMRDINDTLIRADFVLPMSPNDEIELMRTVVDMFKAALQDTPRFKLVRKGNHMQVDLLGIDE